jgi:hypothetical protein
MRLRTRPRMDDPFDGLTAEEIRRIRGAERAWTPRTRNETRTVEHPVETPRRKRGVRA